MNAERLHAVAQAVLDDFEELTLLSLLQKVEAALSTSVSQPNPQNAEAFDQTLNTLVVALHKCESNDFVPSQDRILRCIGGSDKIGVGLEAQLRAILQEEQVTPASALSKIQKHRQKVTEFQEHVSQLADSFDALNIGTDDTKEGEVELGVLMPRELVSNDVGGLSKELSQIDRHLKTFSEIAGATAESLKIRSLSTSSLDVFLSSGPVVAVFVMAAAERLAALYKQTLEIRLLRLQLEEKQIPKVVVDQVRRHEEDGVKQGIEEIGKDLMKEFYHGKDSGRRNELRTALISALKFLADRIDRGVDIEATAAAPVEEPMAEGAVPPPATAEKQALIAIANSGRALRQLNRALEPVLRLPEAERHQTGENDKK